MFDALSDRLRHALAGLTGHGRITEEDVNVAMREVRLALLEADVNYKVVKDFVARVKERAIGQDVIDNVNAGQMVVKIVHEELTAILGAGDRTFRLNGSPATILMVGLQGSGKTTSSAKLARWIVRQGRQPLLVAADPYRPAAVDQLVTLGTGLGIPVYSAPPGTPVVDIATGAVAQARQTGRDVVIVDTAGRLQIDEPLMQELAAVRKAVKPHNVLLVLDAMTGQEAVAVAEAFQERIDFDGVVLTKLDGDARGGAALSVKAVTGKPIKLASTGEKLDQLEYFHPDRMASRILGMGDVLTLIEKAEEAAEADEQEEMERRLRAGQFTFEDFLQSYRMMRRMGPLKSIVGMIPGLGKQLQGADVDDRELSKVEAIVLSMTVDERRRPEIINGSRRARIAKGSGTTVQQVNQLLNARKQMAKMVKQMGQGKMPNLQSIAAAQRRR
jgi:signal recognition particle subunit SRP54